MTTPLGLPEWDEMDGNGLHTYDLISDLLEEFRPKDFYIGSLAKQPQLLEAFDLSHLTQKSTETDDDEEQSKLTDEQKEYLLGEYVKTFSRRINCKNHSRRHYPIEAILGTDRKDGNGCLFRFTGPRVPRKHGGWGSIS